MDYFVLCKKRNVSKYLINILENWLCKSHSRVEWNGSYSLYYLCHAGVRQGGILSPLLFSIFVDEVLCSLSNSGLGCYINFECCNSFMYADDIILLSSTVTGLQNMLNLCSDVFKKLDLPINTEKSHCLRIGPRHRNECAPLDLNGCGINWADKTNFLGVTICRGKNFTCCWRESKNKFFSNANTILGRLGSSAAENVLLKLVDSQGLQSLLYGTTAFALSKYDLLSLDHVYDSVYAKIFNVKSTEIIRQCQYYSGHL